MRNKLYLRFACIFATVTWAQRPALAEGPTAEEFARLSQEVRDQRQLIMQILQMEQQRYDVLLKLMQANGQLPAGVHVPPPPVLPGQAQPEVPTPAATPATVHTGSVVGTVLVKGGEGRPAFVYIEDLRGPAMRGKTLEIAQKDKQFAPQVAAVVRGTRIVFPNVDRVAHNVFSTNKQQPFDLGMTPAGERGNVVTLTSSGVLEIFCSIHAKMWAQVLVVPSAHFAKVDADGRFKLSGVPTGAHSLVAWTANSKPVRMPVTVTKGSVELNIGLSVEPMKPHNNKFAQPYGSYED